MPGQTIRTQINFIHEIKQIFMTTDTTSEVSYYEAVGRRREASARVRLYVVREGSVKVG